MLAGLASVLAAGCKAPNASIAHRPSGTFGNGPETRAYVDGLSFTAVGGLVSQYSCSSCPGGQIRLMIIPDTRAQSRNWQADLAPNAPGDVVAQVINVDNVTFPDLSLAPGDVAYAWVGQIDDSPGGNRGFGIYKLNDAGNTVAKWSLTWKKDIQFCRDDPPHDKPSIKTYHEGVNNCQTIALASGAGENRLAGLGVSAAYAATARSVSTAMAGLGHLWITCSAGCCQVNTR